VNEKNKELYFSKASNNPSIFSLGIKKFVLEVKPYVLALSKSRNYKNKQLIDINRNKIALEEEILFEMEKYNNIIIKENDEENLLIENNIGPKQKIIKKFVVNTQMEYNLENLDDYVNEIIKAEQLENDDKSEKYYEEGY